jgi:hypothetical protein
MLGDPGGATTALERAHGLDPDRAEPLYLLGISTDDPHRAEEYFLRYLAMDPSGPWAPDARARLTPD